MISFFRSTGKVRDVGEQVEYSDDADSERARDTHGALWVLYLRERVIDVTEPDIRPDDLRIQSADQRPAPITRMRWMMHIVQTQAERRRASSRPLERVSEFVRLVHLHEPGEHDEHEHEDLEHAEEVLQASAPFQRKAVQEEREGDEAGVSSGLPRRRRRGGCILRILGSFLRPMLCMLRVSDVYRGGGGTYLIGLRFEAKRPSGRTPHSSLRRPSLVIA